MSLNVPSPWSTGKAIPLFSSSLGRIGPLGQRETSSRGFVVQVQRAKGWLRWAQVAAQGLSWGQGWGPALQPAWPVLQPAQQSMLSPSHQPEGPSVPKYLSPKLPGRERDRVKGQQHQSVPSVWPQGSPQGCWPQP